VRPLAEGSPDSLSAVQLNWIVMQIAIFVLVLAGMIIAATKLWL
jgi:hypothetical protein